MADKPFSPEVEARLRADSAEIISRYPDARSALIPMLHLMQSEEGFVSPRSIALCADILGLTRAQVSAVATFYTQFHRHPTGEYHVGVCTNAVCAILGGDQIMRSVEDHLGIRDEETTDDGKFSLEAIECNAACDYAPVVMINWEFFDNQTPESINGILDDLRDGKPVAPTRGPDQLPTFKENERMLAGFEDGHADEGVGAGESTLRGLKIARDNGWTAPQPKEEN
ncbi:MAG: NADH-quinone oxidoreductase subunit NuoE [Actinomycetaceae bacterium]|nr:NADH-quinone oxidoreductase subunit NuoE [Actinomycetaceae bacterium]MDY6082689.1 NADH-quinone oxidoreductase subunit NuoE [Actinomycetaceae bacterium]